MGFVEWLAVIATPFLFVAVLYFIKEQKDEISKKIDESQKDLKRLQNEIYEFAIEAKNLNANSSHEIFKTKELVRDLQLYQKETLAIEIVKIGKAASEIENYSIKMDETKNLIKALYGKVHVLDEENVKQNKILKILIEKLKKE